MKAERSYAKRLSRRLIGETAALFIVAFLSVSLFSYAIMYMAAIKEADSILEKFSLELESILSRAEATTEGSSWVIDQYSDNKKILASVVKNIVESDTNIVSATICFESGVTVSSVAGAGDVGFRDKEWYRIPKRNGRHYWTDPSLDSEGTGKLISSYSVPLYRSDGSFYGVVKTDFNLEWLADKLRKMRPFKHSYTVLSGSNDTIISLLDGDQLVDKSLFDVAGDEDASKRKDVPEEVISGNRWVERFKKDGEKGVIVHGLLKNGWPVALVCTDNDILEDPMKMNTISLIIAVITLILLYIRSKKIIERESKSVTALSYTALSIAQGNFDSIIPDVNSKDELKRLRDSLGYLEDSIHRYIKELRTSTKANERYESELNIASAIQMQMLPKDYPQFDGVDLYAMLHPAKEVGGDLYDFFIKDRILYFAVGDVSGKGVPAALYMAIARSAFRFIAGLGLPVSGVVSRMNSSFCDGNDSGMFVTMFVARIHLDTLEMEFCNAGHNPIIIISPDGKASYLHAKVNLAAGLFEDFPYQGETLQIEKGSRILIYTDGVTEAENSSKELYNEQRLEAFASSEPMDKSSEEFVADLVADVKKFTKDNEQNDDITIMSIKL